MIFFSSIPRFGVPRTNFGHLDGVDFEFQNRLNDMRNVSIPWFSGLWNLLKLIRINCKSYSIQNSKAATTLDRKIPGSGKILTLEKFKYCDKNQMLGLMTYT